jgi:chromosomal replication initiation ATPase DnaA
MTSGHLGTDQPDKPWQKGLSPRDESVLAREFLYNTVATVFEIDGALLAQPSRGRARFALARQVAMYLGHVACGLSLTAVGRFFDRDRSTVAHACKRVEDRREDKDFDAALQMMETSVRTIVRTSEALRRDLEIAEHGGA